MNDMNRRDLIARILSGAAGVAGPLALFSSRAVALPQVVSNPILDADALPLAKACKIRRWYDAMLDDGTVTHGLEVTWHLPVPRNGALDASCWTGKVVIRHLLPNPATGFTGGTLERYVQGRDSIGAFLLASDLTRVLLEASYENQIGQVVWRDVPQALNMGLPVGAASVPCSSGIPVGGTSQAPAPHANPRFLDPCDDLSEIVLTRDLDRFDADGNKTLVRMLVGKPKPCEGPAPDLVSYTATYQIQGLQAEPGTAWTDGVLTRTGHGLDEHCALMAALQTALGLLLATAEAQAGALIWPLDPSDGTWGLPVFDPSALTSQASIQQFFDALPPVDQERVRKVLGHDWAQHFPG